LYIVWGEKGNEEEKEAGREGSKMKMRDVEYEIHEHF